MVASIRLLSSVFLFVTLVFGMVHGQQECIDNYIWLWDGSVPCSALEQDSVYGLNQDPVRWCAYPLTDCCETCRRIAQQTTTASQQTTSTPQPTTSTPRKTTTRYNDDDD